MRVTSSIVIVFAAAHLLWAQAVGSIRGKVTLKDTGAPLHHASALVVELRRSVQTEEDGSFVVNNVPAGTYRLAAHMHGLSDVTKTVEVRAGETAQVEFALSVAPVHQEITVTASGEEQLAVDAFQTVTALERYEIVQKQAAPSLGELLEYEPGIAKRSFGPGTGRPVIRGFDGDRVLVLQDGMRTGTLSSQSGDHGEPVDANSIERVEVVRGPANLLYGNNAIGGLVNILSLHQQMDSRPHEGVTGQLSAQGGTANGQGGGAGRFDFGRGNWLFWGGGGGLRTGDYRTPIGVVENSHSNIKHASAGFGKYGERFSLSGNYGLQDGRYGVPFVPHQHEEEKGHEEVPVDLAWRRHYARLHSNWRPENLFERIQLTANYSDWRHRELAGDEIGTRFFNKQLTWQGMFQQKRAGFLSGTFGGWGLYRDYSVAGEEALTPPVKHHALAGFALEELNLERVRLQFGGRLENNRYRPSGLPNRSFTGFSGAAAMHLRLWTHGALVTNYTNSYRAPALEELYNRGPHPGNLTFEIGNADLLRERGQGLEVSLRHQSSRLRAEAHTFYYRFRDFVFLAPTGKIEEGLAEAVYLQAPTRYMGAEARLDTQLHPNIWANLRFDVVDAQLRETRLPLPRIPPARGRIGLDYRRNGVSVRPELVLANAQRHLFTNETPTAGYALVNLTGSYTFVRQHAMHVFNVYLFNAGDRLYRNHLSFIKDLAPEIGRGVRFSYTVHFY